MAEVVGVWICVAGPFLVSLNSNLLPLSAFPLIVSQEERGRPVLQFDVLVSSWTVPQVNTVGQNF